MATPNYNTKERIVEITIELIQKKTFSSITIENIINAANINRSTFYYYFEDKYMLRDSIIKDMAEEILKSIPVTNYISIPTSEEICKFIGPLHLKRELFLDLINPHWEIDTLAIITDKFTTKIRKWAEEQKNTCYPTDLFVRLYAISAIATVEWSLKNDIDPKEEAEIIARHLQHGFFKDYLGITD